MDVFERIARQAPTRTQLSKMTEETQWQFLTRRDLQGLDPGGRRCEVCGRTMHAHSWAVLNLLGDVVSCSFVVTL